MYWHIDTEIISLIVIASIYIYHLKTISGSKRDAQNNSFLWCLRVGILVTIIDIFASVAMEVPVSIPFYHVMMTLDFLALELTIVFWYRYCISILYYDNERAKKTALCIVELSYLPYALLILSNPWSGLIYTLSSSGEYARGPLFFIMVAVYAVYSFSLLIVIIVRHRCAPAGYPIQVMLLSPVILAVSITAQLTVGGWLMILPGYMVSLVLAFLFLQTRRNRDSQALVNRLSTAAMTDKLTGLYNRAGMEYMVHSSEPLNTGKTCLIAVIDIDSLKSINDSMGHPEGDRAIQAVAGALRQHFRASDLLARFGGDEFVAYLVGDWTRALAYKNLGELVEEIGLLSVGDADRIPIHASIGALLSVVGEDSFGQLCKRADTALYHVKQHGKNSCAFYTPSMETVVFDMPETDGDLA